MFKSKKIVVILISFILIYAVFIQNEEISAQEANKGALGFNVGFGGSGLSYKYFFTDEDALQITGRIHGDSDYINYEVGFLYNRILHENINNRLIFAPGFSYNQILDFNDQTGEQELTAAISFGIEFGIDRFENVKLGLLTGYRATFASNQNPLSFGPAVNVSVFYYF